MQVSNYLVRIAPLIADTEARFLEDFPSWDDTGIKLIRDVAEAHLMFLRAASANCADATLRADRRLTKAVKTLKARARQRKDAPKTTPAEWGSIVTGNGRQSRIPIANESLIWQHLEPFPLGGLPQTLVEAHEPGPTRVVLSPYQRGCKLQSIGGTQAMHSQNAHCCLAHLLSGLDLIRFGGK